MPRLLDSPLSVQYRGDVSQASENHENRSLNSYDVLTMGRIGVDLYPEQVRTPLEQARVFRKYLGGSATNVAVAASRHTLRAAVITGVGSDPFGRFCIGEVARLGVDPKHIHVDQDNPTPITFCEIFPPDDFPLYFYRFPKAPDLNIQENHLDAEAIRGSKVFWLTVTGLSEDPSRTSHFTALKARGRKTHTILDLDYRPMFWDSQEQAREQIQKALEHVTVAVGNQEECRVAVDETDPEHAADALLDRGVQMAIVKQGPKGVMAKTAEETVVVPPHHVDVVNGLGAGDSFGGALTFGLLQGWELERILRFANVAGAIVASRHECATAMPTTSEINSILKERSE